MKTKQPEIVEIYLIILGLCLLVGWLGLRFYQLEQRLKYYEYNDEKQWEQIIKN